MTEVLDQYHGPDVRKLWLLSWAEKANDYTRAGWPTREVLAHRTGKSPSRVSHIAEELVAEGVLKRDGGGNRGGPARFILLPLAHAKGAPRAHPLEEAGADPDDTRESVAGADEGAGKGAPRAHPSESGKGAAETHPKRHGKGAPRAHPKPEVKGADPAGKGAESGVKGADPTPLPAETGSLPLINPHIDQPSEEPLADAGAPTAQTVLAAFIDWVRGNGGALTKRTVGTLASQIAALLQQSIPDRHIRQGLADWFMGGQHPGTLDSYVNASVNAEARARAALNGHGSRRPTQEPTTTERARQAIEAGAEAAEILRRGAPQ